MIVANNGGPAMLHAPTRKSKDGFVQDLLINSLDTAAHYLNTSWTVGERKMSEVAKNEAVGKWTNDHNPVSPSLEVRTGAGQTRCRDSAGVQ